MLKITIASVFINIWWVSGTDKLLNIYERRMQKHIYGRGNENKYQCFLHLFQHVPAINRLKLCTNISKNLNIENTNTLIATNEIRSKQILHRKLSRKKRKQGNKMTPAKKKSLLRPFGGLNLKSNLKPSSADTVMKLDRLNSTTIKENIVEKGLQILHPPLRSTENSSYLHYDHQIKKSQILNSKFSLNYTKPYHDFKAVEFSPNKVKLREYSKYHGDLKTS